MGTFFYGNTLQFEFDDRTLEHVKTVIFAKLRRRESFSLTWSRHGTTGSGSGSGPVSVWVSPSVPLAFETSCDEPIELSREWVDALMKLSYTNRGLVVLPEPEASAPSPAAG